MLSAMNGDHRTNVRRRSIRNEGGGRNRQQSLPPPADPVNPDLSITDIFPEVPAEERLGEKVRSMLSTKVGTLYITHNYLCWSGLGKGQVVMHFGEIVKLEKSQKFLDSIEVMARSGAISCDNDREELVGANAASLPLECANCKVPLSSLKGCRGCNTPLCPECAQKHRDRSAPQKYVNHTLRPVDLDRVYKIILGLWKAHLRIPERERKGRPLPAAEPDEGADDTAADENIPMPDHQSPLPEAELLEQIKYVAQTEAKFFTKLDEVRKPTQCDPADKLTLKDTDLARIFAGVFSEQSSFAKQYRIARADKDFEIPEWTHPPSKDDPSVPDKSTGTRLITFITKTVMGLKKVNEAQRYWWTSKCLTLHTSSQCPDVTYGTSFRTETLHDFAVEGDNVTITNYYNILWLKSIFVKTPVQNAVVKECTATFVFFLKCVKDGVRKVKRAGAGSPGVEEENAGEEEDSGDEAVEEAPKKAVSIQAVKFWCSVALGLSVLGSILVAVSSSESNLIQQLPQLRSVHAELGAQVKRLQRDGTKQHIPASRLLQQRNLPQDAAIPILYDLLEREITRFMWMRWLATLSCTLAFLVCGGSFALQLL